MIKRIIPTFTILLVLTGCVGFGPPPPGTTSSVSRHERQAYPGYDYQHGSREFRGPDGRLIRRGEIFRRETPHGNSTVVENCQLVVDFRQVCPAYGRCYMEDVPRLECREVFRLESYRDPPRYYRRPDLPPICIGGGCGGRGGGRRNRR